MTMENDNVDIGAIFAAIKRRKGLMISLFLLGVIATVLTAVLLPSTYRSAAIVQIEQQEIPQDLVRSTITSYADQRIQMIGQRIQSAPNLERLIKKYNLYEEELRQEGLEEVFLLMREDINLQMISADVVDPRSGRATQANIAFNLSFDSEDPVMAQRVANDMVELFLSENRQTRTRMAKETAQFLVTESEKLQRQIKELEKELTTFKEQHSGELPELQQVNLQMMQRTENQLLEVDRQLRQLEERQIYLNGQLAQIDPNDTTYDAAGRAIQGPEDRLRMLESEYSRVVASYTPDHPDVNRLRKEIDVLRAQLGISDQTGLIAELQKAKDGLTSARERYSDSHPDVKRLTRTIAALERQIEAADAANFKPSKIGKPNNPAYIQLQSQLNAARTEARSLRETKQELNAKLDDYEARLTSAPAVEKDYRSLTREYDRTLQQYAETRNRQMEAELAESLEQGRQGERFSVIDPPRMPIEPVKPNRWAIAFLGLILSIGLSGGAVAAAEALDDAIYGERGLKALLGDMGTTPLATIPYIPTPAQQVAGKATALAAIGGFLLVIGGALVAVHYLYRPLDILWFMAMRKLGLG